MPRRAPAYLANLIPGLQATGVSATGALEWLKGNVDRLSARDQAAMQNYSGPATAGMGGLRRQNFLRLWGATQSEGSIRATLAAADIYHVPTQAEIVRVPRPKARGFQYNVDVLVRDPTSGSFHFTPSAIVTPDLITHLEAIERASRLLGRMQSMSDRGTPAGEVRMGGFVTGVLERVPEDYEEPET